MSSGVINLNDVSLRRQSKLILEQINWRVHKGEHWAILGANGSGKTSLLKLITGYEWATTGSIEVLGERFGHTAVYELRKRIGWLSASLDEKYRNYEGLSCVDVIISGKYASVGIHETVSEKEIEDAFTLAHEMGLKEVARSQLRTLSQGERKKTFFARALMSSPEIVIVDEPTSGLDLAAREHFLSKLETIHTKSNSPSLLYVTHYPEEIIPAVTHVLLLKDGKIVAADKKENVLTDELLSYAFGMPIYVNWRDERPWIQIGTYSKQELNR
ncbi:ABC transporter ATP-binding protein [Alkalicoccobacillus gibsonii]|jgi:iron complex transport system ATP-binding protein|uniref:ABC transporter ATP-binding protein n=1 Tax=Alkalicoccobacillus gibsonii TaxID=79881 RepID=UPI0019329403|nr:ABC transporter ATP-binding protein [Alkalicoccobacillus gibsonii]MBM0064734.1 ABC transporter ATP-binding protein [Alkalicoccobacillus gibsonii]